MVSSLRLEALRVEHPQCPPSSRTVGPDQGTEHVPGSGCPARLPSWSVDSHGQSPEKKNLSNNTFVVMY